MFTKSFLFASLKNPVLSSIRVYLPLTFFTFFKSTSIQNDSKEQKSLAKVFNVWM